MLRKTSSGGYERQDSDGNWQPVSAEEARAATATSGVAPEPVADQGDVATMIDSLVDELNGKDHDTGLPMAETEPVLLVATDPPITPEIAQAATDALNAAMAEPETAPGDFDLDVPGLVSTDSSRGTKGFQTVKERLKANAKKRREPKRVEVGASAAQVVGPARKEGTAARQSRKAQERLEAGKAIATGGESGLKQRYVSRPAPALFDGRPKWVQDLFEAHFRSEHTLGMRRAHNRMKISRTDYAIGWLTAFDKFREEASLLRLKSGSGD